MGPRLLRAARLAAMRADRFVRRRLWSRQRALGLRANLAELPAPRRAKVAVEMRPTPPAGFGGFDAELARDADADSLDLLDRVRLCRGRVTTLYVATDPAGSPIYAQWLVRPAEQAALHVETKGLFPPLAGGEVLLEGAFTFSAFRQQGAMADGMHQLLALGRDEGASSAITYVTDDNAPSLRGCARAGFELDHVRVTVRRLGVRRSRRAPLDDDARAAWARATG